MTPPAGTRERTRGDGSEPPPGDELVALLWVLAVLLGALELTWWIFARMYGG
jgi:hypothetical protein